MTKAAAAARPARAREPALALAAPVYEAIAGPAVVPDQAQAPVPVGAMGATGEDAVDVHAGQTGLVLVEMGATGVVVLQTEVL